MSRSSCITAYDVLPSPARVDARSTRAPLRVGARAAALARRSGRAPRRARRRRARMAAGEGARARVPAGADALAVLRDHRPTARAPRASSPSRSPADRRTRSRPSSRPRPACTCTRRSTSSADGGASGYNTAIVVAPDGALVARTRKLHLPVTAGYYEDRYFRPGDTGYPVVARRRRRVRLPDVLGPVVPRGRRARTRCAAPR